MRKLIFFLYILSLYPQGGDCVVSQNSELLMRIAILSDPHVQDTSRLRSMDEQLHSTRLFNENYFAFIAALDDIVKRNIHYVVLPGDLTDDGQPVNVRLIRNLLQEYTEKHQITFLVMTGNHDPVRPFTTEENQGDLCKWGYKEIHNEWASFGFQPQANYLYWETPFSTYSYEDYTLEKAKQEAVPDRRVYKYLSETGAELNPAISDGSYLVELTDGLWALMIDASVYHPAEIQADSIISFKGAGTGYKDVLQVKKHLLPWIQKVAAEAKKRNKTLVAFSHYPMSDYNSGGGSFISGIANPGRFDVQRFPDAAMTDLLADAGITLHFGGHIHMNDDAMHISPKGNKLRNIQVPSTGGYIPSYKILTFNTKEDFTIETIPLDTVPGFDSFFDLYRAEHDSLQQTGSMVCWNDNILSAPNYHRFCEAHLTELVRLRFLPNDLIPLAAEQFAPMKAEELFIHAGIPTHTSMDWTGFDMIVDFYKLRMGGKSALSDIDPTRLNQYNQLIDKITKSSPESELDGFLFSFCKMLQARLSSFSD